MQDAARRSCRIAAHLPLGRSILIPFPKLNLFSGFSPSSTINSPCPNKGFTLVEVIVTLVAVGIMSVIFLNFMGTAMSRSADSIERVRAEARAEEVAETIIADYVFEMNRNPSGAFAALQAKNYGSDVDVKLNDYISFDKSTGQVISPTDNNTLRVKVTVKDIGNSLTFLLTKSRPSGFAAIPVAF